MTIEEAKEYIYDCLDHSEATEVIKALEPQPCEDCVSRQGVLDVINFEDEWLFDAKSHNADTKIAFSAIKSKISELPSVTPQQKIGRWIFHEPFDNGRKNCNECIECSQCHTWFGHDCYAKTPYCPKCGAKMIESEDEE